MKAWGGVGEAYAASYAELCAGTGDALVAALGPAQGSLLDVGSGTGALAARFQDAGWRTTGCEPEPTMRAVSEREHPDLPVVDGALPDLPFEDGCFDAVVANFVLNHVPDPRAAAHELARVSRGALVATIWVRSPSWFWLEVCEAAGLEPAAGERLPADKDFERTASGFTAMLEESGWTDVRTRELTWTWRAEPARLWASAEGGVASAGLFYRGLDAADRSAFRAGFDAVCARRAHAGAVGLEHTAAIAVKPAVLRRELSSAP